MPVLSLFFPFYIVQGLVQPTVKMDFLTPIHLIKMITHRHLLNPVMLTVVITTSCYFKKPENGANEVDGSVGEGF